MVAKTIVYNPCKLSWRWSPTRHNLGHFRGGLLFADSHWTNKAGNHTN